MKSGVKNYLKIGAWVIRVLFVPITISFLFIPNYGYFLSGILVISASLFLVSKEKKYGSKFPAGFDFFINGVLLMHMLGYASNLYDRFLHWDTWQHFLAGVVIGILGYAGFLAYKLKHKIPISYRMCFFMAMMLVALVGTSFELLEFGIDKSQLFDFSGASGHTRMQWDLEDTMDDIVANTLGAAVAGVTGYVLYKGKDPLELEEELAYLVKIHK